MNKATPPVASPLVHIWPDVYSQEFTVWGKQVVLRALENTEITEINDLIAQQPQPRQVQALIIATVAKALISVDGLEFKDAQTGQPLSFSQRLSEVTGWDDPLTALLFDKARSLNEAYREAALGIADPN